MTNQDHIKSIPRGMGKLLVKDQLLELVPYSISHIWRLEQDGKFPRRVKIGESRVAWLASEVEAWIEGKALDRGSTPDEGEA